MRDNPGRDPRQITMHVGSDQRGHDHERNDLVTLLEFRSVRPEHALKPWGTLAEIVERACYRRLMPQAIMAAQHMERRLASAEFSKASKHRPCVHDQRLPNLAIPRRALGPDVVERLDQSANP